MQMRCTGRTRIVADRLCLAWIAKVSSYGRAPDWITKSWSVLPPHVQEAISTLVEAGLAVAKTFVNRDASRSLPNGSFYRTQTARRLARECRNIVQACLREEEWRDADDEFSAIIKAGLIQYEKRTFRS
jgi:hypothetical protein